MEVTLFKMFPVVVAVIVLTGSSYAGYIYPRPNVAFDLPKKTSYFREELENKAVNENTVLNTLESVVSYSVPFEDFNYLHQLKTDHQQSAKVVTNVHTPRVAVDVPNVIESTVNNLASSAPVVNIPGNVPNDNIPIRSLPVSNVLTSPASLNIPTSINHQNSLLDNLLHHTNIPAINVATVPAPTTIQQESQVLVSSKPHINDQNLNINGISIPTSLTQQSHLEGNTFPQITIPIDNRIPAVSLNSPIQQHKTIEINSMQHLNIPASNIPNIDSPVLTHQNTDLQHYTEQRIINHEAKIALDNPVNVQNFVTPKITKHIYFHAPPPEIEEPVTSVHTISPKKKIYKIIFIKVPSQTTKNNIQLQGNANNIAPIDEKTIIYVLSKKPDAPQSLLLPTPSEHEVFFVKYSGNPVIASEGIDTLEQPDSELLSTPRLQPGLINGKR